MPDTKMIIVKSRGLVHTSRGLIQSPIMYPYRESVDKIWGMISQDRADVYEVLRNKRELKLDAQNFDLDNNAIQRDATSSPKPFTGVENMTQPPVISVEPEKPAETREQRPNNNGQNTWKNQNSKNKHDKKNNQQRQNNNQNNQNNGGQKQHQPEPEKASEQTENTTPVDNGAKVENAEPQAAPSETQGTELVDKAAASAELAVEPEEI